jgi:hypothetical protein
LNHRLGIGPVTGAIFHADHRVWIGLNQPLNEIERKDKNDESIQSDTRRNVRLKLKFLKKDPNKFSKETVQMFFSDAKKSNYSIN